MDKQQIITYKLVASSEIAVEQVGQKEWGIKATTLKGTVRSLLQEKSQQLDRIEELIFGSENAPAQIYFTHAVCKNTKSFSRELNIIDTSEVPSYLNSITIKNIEFIGKVLFRSSLKGIERSAVLSTILDIPRIGRGKHDGLGDCKIQIMNRDKTTVFISYSWDSAEHKSWVLELAEQISKYDIDVILDQLSPAFNESSPQEEINSWMTQGIENCDKVLAILTPNYCHKANHKKGGVGFEYHSLLSETGLISENLHRYIGIIQGDLIAENEIPKILIKNPTVKMTETISKGAILELVDKIRC